ncbi:MAG: hypothetical protein ABMA64_02410 [Myxococcota bacterium]
MWAATMIVLLDASALGAPRCPTEAQRGVVDAFARRLEGAGTADEAQREALAKIDLGRRAIDAASKVVRDEDGIATAAARLDGLERAVREADSPAAVGAAFHRLNDNQVMDCHYDTVEVAIIVIGFILGILPGILFLILFC